MSVCLHWLVNGDVLLLAGGEIVPPSTVAGNGNVLLLVVGRLVLLTVKVVG